MNQKKVLVAIIAYNEEKNIELVLRDLSANNCGFDVVVIDNGSSDQTASVAQGLGYEVVSHCTNSGGSMGTVMTYFLYAYKRNYDVLCQFDGDGQHIATELPKILAPILAGKADYVIGSRFLEKKGFQSHFFRRIGISFFALLDSLIIKQKVTDVTSGFRAYNRNVIEFFAKHYRHELYDTSQLLLLSYYMGARIQETPVLMKERVHGTSEFRSIKALFFPFRGVINILGCLIQGHRPTQLEKQ